MLSSFHKTIYALIFVLECCTQAIMMPSLISECPKVDVWFHPMPDVLGLAEEL